MTDKGVAYRADKIFPEKNVLSRLPRMVSVGRTNPIIYVYTSTICVIIYVAMVTKIEH